MNDFLQLVCERLGLQIKPQNMKTFRKSLSSRMKALNLTEAEYHHLLKQDADNEWAKLVPLITTGETYFFRDKAQIETLSERILPELVERRSKRRSLRIWSAGCASGEEAYTLAILASEAVAGQNDWEIRVFGTDINKIALDKANQGIYCDWSFRAAEPFLKERYFRNCGEKWRLRKKIRSMVTFSVGNLLVDDFFASKLWGMDLIVCRNVFIYFDRDAVSNVVKKFSHVLRLGGYLMLGHGEMRDRTVPGTMTIVFPKSIVYRRTENDGENDGLFPRQEAMAEKFFDKCQKIEGQQKKLLSQRKVLQQKIAELNSGNWNIDFGKNGDSLSCPENSINLINAEQAAKNLTGILEQIHGALNVPTTLNFTVNFKEIIEESIFFARKQAAGKPLRIGSEIPKVLSQIDTCPAEMRQVLDSLITNAMKFTEQGQVNVCAKSTRNRIEVEIRYTGCGIDEQKLDSLFTAFENVDASIVEKYCGPGLELAMTKKSCERLGISLQIDDMVGRESRFLLKIPLKLPKTR